MIPRASATTAWREIPDGQRRIRIEIEFLRIADTIRRTPAGGS